MQKRASIRYSKEEPSVIIEIMICAVKRDTHAECSRPAAARAILTEKAAKNTETPQIRVWRCNIGQCILSSRSHCSLEIIKPGHMRIVGDFKFGSLGGRQLATIPI